MNIVCEVCGDIGFKQLLLCCRDCKDSAAHQYCLDKVVFEASLADWLCYECKQRCGEVTCSRSLEKVSSERPSNAQVDSTVQQPITKGVDSAVDSGPWRNRKSKSCMTKYALLNKFSSSTMNSPRKKRTSKKPNMRPMGSCTKRKGHITTSIAHAIAKGLQGTETAKRKNCERQQVDSENFVCSLYTKQPSPLIVNGLGYALGDSDQCHVLKATEGLARNSKRTPKLLRAPFRGLVKKRKKKVLGEKNKSSNPTAVHGNSVLEKSCANLSFEHTDQDNQTNQHALVGCKNVEVKCGNDNKTVACAHQDKYRPVALLGNKLDKSEAQGDSDSNVMGGLMPEREREDVRFQLDYRASNEFHQRSMAAHVPQPSSLQDDAVDKVMPYSPNMCMLAKENNCLPSGHIEKKNRKENQSEPSKLLDQTYSGSPLETKFLLEDSAAQVQIPVDFGKDNSRKRRRLILPYDDDNEEENAKDVQLENVNSRSLKCDALLKNHKIDIECCVEAVRTGDLRNSNPNNEEPVKKRRRYIDANDDEDEEANVDVANAGISENDVANFSLSDGVNLESQTVVAEGHPFQFSIAANSDSADEQNYICSQPVDEPVWSGVFKMNGEVFGKLDAHLSNKACQKVWDLSRTLQPVVEVMKLPQLQAWPKRWTSATPTDDCIGLFFFPRSSRPNEVSNKIVNEIIETDDALKVTVGTAELLIFPSTLLPERNHFFQGKYYLWGVFKRRKDMSDRAVVGGEQDGSACAGEERELHDQNLLDQQDEVQRESSDQETSLLMHVNQQRNREGQMEALKIAETEGTTLPDSNLSYAKPNCPKAGSNCSMHPGIDHELHAAEEVNREEDFSSPEGNASSVTEQAAEGGHEQSHTVLEPPTTKLFGLVAARTPRAQQLIQEMASEGALIFPVTEQMVTNECFTGSSVGIGSELKPDANYQHLSERPQSFDFISMGHGDPDVASEACLELFPLRQETMGWAPKVEPTKEVDLDLSLGACSQAPSVQL